MSVANENNLKGRIMKKFIVILVLLCSVTAFGAPLYSLPDIGDIDTWGTDLNDYLNAVKGGVSVKEYGATGDGTTDDRTALFNSNAIGKTLLFPSGTYRVSSNLTLSVPCVFFKGAKLSIDTGIVVTISGDVSASPQDLFDGLGTVVFSKTPQSGFLVEWWGGVADDSTNNSVPLQALENAIGTIGGNIVFQNGTYKFEDSVYFDSTTNDIKFTFRGQGFGTVLHLNDAALDEDFLLYLNETSGSATALEFPGLRYEVRDLKVLGDTTQTLQQGFIRLNNSFFTMTNVEMNYLLYGVRCTQVCDNVTFKEVSFSLQTPVAANPTTITEGSYLYKNEFSGDGLIMDSCHGSPWHQFNGLAKIKNCNGGQFNACVNGTFDLLDCTAIQFNACHLETYKSVPGIKIKNSRVGINDCILWSYLRVDSAEENPAGIDFIGTVTDQYPIEISDGGAIIDNSQVSITGCTFLTKHFAAISHKTKPEIYINSPRTRFQLDLRNSKSGFQITGGKLATSGITILSSDAGLNTELELNRGLLSSNVQVLNDGNAGWQVTNAEGEGIVDYPLMTATPSIFSVVQEDSTPVGNLDPSEEYFYRIASINPKGQTIKSAEVSEVTEALVTKTGAILLTCFGRAPYSEIRIWRGLAADTYTHYVDIPLTAGVAMLYDNGENVNGYLWVTAAVPTVQTVNTSTTFTDTDTSPSVSGGKFWFTGTTGATFSRFDDGVIGQEITVISKGAIVYDVDGNLLECGTTDLTTASGDVTMWVCESTATSTTNVWRMISHMDNAANQN
jgi:hypothetical protein